jgi:hypothetical protein
MRPLCEKCGREIPRRRLENGSRVGAEVKYCSRKCQVAAKQARYRQQAPTRPQQLLHLRNLVAHGMVAEKVLRDPAVIETARQNLVRWRSSNDSPALREWSRILEHADDEAIVRILLSVDEEGMRLRSSSPFTGILGSKERRLVFEQSRKS